MNALVSRIEATGEVRNEHGHHHHRSIDGSIWVGMDVSAVSRRGRELAVIGKQRDVEGFGKRDVPVDGHAPGYSRRSRL
jgi:hypothetical protein